MQKMAQLQALQAQQQQMQAHHQQLQRLTEHFSQENVKSNQ